MTIQIHDPIGQLLKEIQYPGITQESVAITYSEIIRQAGAASECWPQVNAAIQAKWRGRTALDRIKRMAWARIAGGN